VVWLSWLAFKIKTESNRIFLWPADEGTEFTLMARIDSNVLKILWANHILSRCIQL
jgi:hypothetical protein